jgi:transcription elongation factor GreA
MTKDDVMNGGAEVLLTPEGYLRLREEYELLTKVKRPEAEAWLREAREIAGDFADNPDHLAARAELDLIMRRIEVLDERLRAARPLEPGERSSGIISIGSRVVLDDLDDGTREAYVLVSSSESNPAEGRLSNESPVGKAIEGRRGGDVVEVRAPHGIRHLRITQDGAERRAA